MLLHCNMFWLHRIFLREGWMTWWSAPRNMYVVPEYEKILQGSYPQDEKLESLVSDVCSRRYGRIRQCKVFIAGESLLERELFAKNVRFKWSDKLSARFPIKYFVCGAKQKNNGRTQSRLVAVLPRLHVPLPHLFSRVVQDVLEEALCHPV